MTSTVKIDPTRCRGVGICAHAAPSLLRLDRWGYPIVPRDALDEPARDAATRALTACPHRALFIADDNRG